MPTKTHVHERFADRSKTFRRVDHATIEQALGAQAVSERRSERGSPFSVGAIRSKLLAELVSSGGRKGRSSAFARTKIPLTEQEWNILDQLTALVKSQGVNATPGQVAGVLLHQSMTEVLVKLERERAFREAPSTAASELTDAELEETVDTILAAAASANEYVEKLKPVAKELVRRMREGKGAECEDER